jgi:hypothetical protein
MSTPLNTMTPEKIFDTLITRIPMLMKNTDRLDPETRKASKETLWYAVPLDKLAEYTPEDAEKDAIAIAEQLDWMIADNRITESVLPLRQPTTPKYLAQSHAGIHLLMEQAYDAEHNNDIARFIVTVSLKAPVTA